MFVSGERASVVVFAVFETMFSILSVTSISDSRILLFWVRLIGTEEDVVEYEYANGSFSVSSFTSCRSSYSPTFENNFIPPFVSDVKIWIVFTPWFDLVLMVVEGLVPGGGGWFGSWSNPVDL